MPVYMKIDGITGEATEDKHKQWIEALSFASPLARKIPDGAFGLDARSRGFLVFGNIVMTRKVDASSVPLAREAALGTVHPTIEIHVTTNLQGGEKNLIEYKLSKALVAAQSIDVTVVSNGPQSLHETVEINFAKIEWKYSKYKSDGSPDGNIPGWYDRELAKGG